MDQEDNSSKLNEEDYIGDYFQLQDQLEILNVQSFGQSQINDFQLQDRQEILQIQCLAQSLINDFHIQNEQDSYFNQFNEISQMDEFPQQNQQVQKSTTLLNNKKNLKKAQQKILQHQDIQVGQNDSNWREKEQGKKKESAETKNLAKYYGKCCVKNIQNQLINEQDKEMEEILNSILDNKKSCNNCQQLGKMFDVVKFKNIAQEYFADFDFFKDLFDSYQIIDVAPVIQYVNELMKMSYENQKFNFKDPI